MDGLGKPADRRLGKTCIKMKKNYSQRQMSYLIFARYTVSKLGYETDVFIKVLFGSPQFLQTDYWILN
jgi:hypothetical protein